MNECAPLDNLEEEHYGLVICYPRYSPEELKRRLTEMRTLGVEALCFVGEKNVGSLRVLGKGCVGIVVLARTKNGEAALKIRRTDADRSEMKHEAEMLQIANSVGVGTKLLSFSENLLLMEFMSGPLLPKWVENVRAEKDAGLKVRGVLRETLEQCRRLDEAGLDHGELVYASKHIVVDAEDTPCLLDFETASTMRRVSNVTSVCNYLFLSGEMAELTKEWFGKMGRNSLIEALRRYKRSPSRIGFEEVLRNCLL
jgi:putative serine/threonine protein kinase